MAELANGMAMDADGDATAFGRDGTDDRLEPVPMARLVDRVMPPLVTLAVGWFALGVLRNVAEAVSGLNGLGSEDSIKSMVALGITFVVLLIPLSMIRKLWAQRATRMRSYRVRGVLHDVRKADVRRKCRSDSMDEVRIDWATRATLIDPPFTDTVVQVRWTTGEVMGHPEDGQVRELAVEQGADGAPVVHGPEDMLRTSYVAAVIWALVLVWIAWATSAAAI